MSDEGKFKATMTRAQWRETYLKCQVVPPQHRDAERWMGDACAEIHDVAEVEIKVATGRIEMKEFKDRRGDESVELKLSINAIRGIKYACTRTLLGYGELLPANRITRAMILESLRYVGPGQKVMKKVMEESKLPDSNVVDDGLDLESEPEVAPEKKG